MKIKNNIIIDGTLQHEDGGASNEVFTTNGGRSNFLSSGASTDIGNNISVGSDGAPYFNEDKTIEAHAAENSGFKRCYFLTDIADDFSDLEARADAAPINREMFAFRLIGGGFGVCCKTGDYNLNKMQVAVGIVTSSESGFGLTDRYIYWWQPFSSNGVVTGSYTRWTQSNLQSNMSAQTTDQHAFIWLKPAEVGTGGASPTIVSGDANNALSAGGDGGAYLNTSSLGEANNVVFVADEASRPGTGVVDTVYIAKAENTLWEWNGSSYDQLGDGGGGAFGEAEVVGTSRQYTQQQNFAQQTLTDAATLAWDFDTQQVAILTATGAVGNLRTLPNTAITAGVNGGNYQLTFVQDATGGRKINFESNYNVVGAFDLGANKRTLITVIVQGTQADVILTPVIDPDAPQALTGTDLDMSKYFGNTYNYGAASSGLTYTTNNPVVNGFARCYINAASEPVVYETDGTTPATKVNSSAFIPNTLMEMVVESPDGTWIEYYFIER